MLTHLTVKKIPLHSSKHPGLFALVDDEDYKWLSLREWGVFVAVAGSPYAAFWDNKGVDVLMHRDILGLSKGDGLKGDHKDGNTLNNQRANLRRATHAQNMRNRKLQNNNTTGFKGVYFRPKQLNFIARLKHDGKDKYLGSFGDEVTAAQAYDVAARANYGEFARLNFPD